MRDLQLFTKAVGVFFEPLASKHDLSLSEAREGVYDISSQHFIMRIRLHTGHRRGLNVSLRPASFREFDENEPGVELGIWLLIEFYGHDPRDVFVEVSSDESFLKQVELLAVAAERYGLPFLLGHDKDWEIIKSGVERKTKKDLEQIRKYKFLKNQ
jgi:hypothetical protein